MRILVCFLLIIISITLSSCMKEIDPIPPTDEKIPLDKIQVSAAFDWSTSKTLTVDITGLPTQTPIYSTLSLMLEDGTTIYQQLHKMDDNLSLKLIVPVETREILMKYDIETYLIAVEGKSANFSFIPVVKDE